MVTTFLPYSDFQKSLSVLDRSRLGKQRIECKQIIAVLQGESQGWKNHPAVKMWIGYLPAISHYYNLCLKEWETRGYKNDKCQYIDIVDPIVMPWYIGWEPFHLSHQASLMRKDTSYYKDKFKVPDFYLTRGYIWPSPSNNLSSLSLKELDSRGIFAKIRIISNSSLSFNELRSIAKKNSIVGYGKLNKIQLVELLSHHKYI